MEIGQYIVGIWGTQNSSYPNVGFAMLGKMMKVRDNTIDLPGEDKRNYKEDK
jgi:hypothetical protein